MPRAGAAVTAPKINPSDLQPGDEIEIVLRGTVGLEQSSSSMPLSVLIRGAGCTSRAFSAAELAEATITRVEKPWAPGDHALLGSMPCVVLAVDIDEAWVKDASGRRFTHPISGISRR